MLEIEQVKEIKLFQDLTVTEIEGILGIVKMHDFKAGETIFRENETGKKLYMVIDGAVRISKLIPTGEQVTFTLLKKGKFFGELSLLTQKAHSATAEALENTRVMVIHKIDFEKFVEVTPQAGFKILRAIICEISELLKQMNNKFIDIMSYMWH